MSIDRPIARKERKTTKYIIISVGITLLGMMAWRLGDSATGHDYIRIDTDSVIAAQVRKSDMTEYIPITGIALAKNTVYLDLKVGGIVENIAVQSGNFVNKGDLIVSLSNATLQKDNIDSESLLLQSLDRLTSSEIAMTERSLSLQEDMVGVGYELKEAESKYGRNLSINNLSKGLVATGEMEDLKNKVSYLTQRKTLIEDQMKEEKTLHDRQRKQNKTAAERLTSSFGILTNIGDNLNVRAPINGYLSSMNAISGQHFNQGERIGQIDQLDNLIIRANVDQYYISRISEGLKGTLTLNGELHNMVIDRIFPEVTNNTFQVDFSFSGSLPSAIKRGQSITIRLELSGATSSKVVSKGAFFRHTSGRWVYKLSDDGKGARKAAIKVGMQNPEDLEIIDGLVVGDWIVSSSYESFNDVDELIFDRDLRKGK